MVAITVIIIAFKYCSGSICGIDERFVCLVLSSTFITVTWDGLIIIGNIVQPKILNGEHLISLCCTVVACKSNLLYLCHIGFGHLCSSSLIHEIFPFVMIGNIAIFSWNIYLKGLAVRSFCYYSEFHSLCGQTHSSGICASQAVVKREIIVPLGLSLYLKSIFSIIIFCRLHIGTLISECKLREVISFSIVLYISGEFGYHFGLRIYFIQRVCRFFRKFLVGFIIPAEEFVFSLLILETEGSGLSWRNITIRRHFPVRVSLLIDIRLCRIAWINGTLDMDSIGKIGNEINVISHFPCHRIIVSALTISSPTGEHHFLIIRFSIEFYIGVVCHSFI